MMSDSRNQEKVKADSAAAADGVFSVRMASHWYRKFTRELRREGFDFQTAVEGMLSAACEEVGPVIGPNATAELLEGIARDIREKYATH